MGRDHLRLPLRRVALARAVYARTKYVLLDDPLSAVVSCPRYSTRTEPDRPSMHVGQPHLQVLVRKTSLWTFACKPDSCELFH